MHSAGGWSGYLVRRWAIATARCVRTRVIQSTVTRAYQWGSLTCSYSASNDQVRIGINVTNTTPYEIRGLILKVAGLAVQMPANRAMLRLTPTKHNLEGPDIISLTRGDTTVLVANEELAKFLDLEVQQAPGGVAVVLNTQMQARLMPARLAHFGTQMRQLAVTRPIPAQSVDHYSLVIGFVGVGKSRRAPLSVVFERFAKRFPSTLRWPDRRPIGLLMLASHGKNSQFNPLNPRFWRIVPPTLDVTSAAGRAEFQELLLKEADKTIAVARQMGAQGVIVWDIEGQQYPFPASYVGDPRLLAPEMQEVAARFFKRFTDAGLRCGVNAGGRKFVVESQSKAYQEAVDNPDALVQLIDAKIQFVRQHWGCTLFYIDAPGEPNWPADASVFRTLAASHPDVLLIPEQKTLIDYAWTAPFSDLRAGTPPTRQARWIYPRAFGVIDVTAAKFRPADANWQTLVESVKAGDVLTFVGWQDEPNNQAVLQIYQNALGSDWRKADRLR